ncbi:unnamed protein product [Dibothriocephalus latus]|uniref:Uncharacterized protein n=1 Tax=Dibothriocephalus latus TaxID=60516 RepID=A0A3P7LT64_DIBLA|nr:unnamed protein product [Dibothriocephalus latus]
MPLKTQFCESKRLQIPKLMMPAVLLFFIFSNACQIKNTQPSELLCPTAYTIHTFAKLLLEFLHSLKSEAIFEQELLTSFEMTIHTPTTIEVCWFLKPDSQYIVGAIKCSLTFSSVTTKYSAKELNATSAPFYSKLVYEFNLGNIHAEALLVVEHGFIGGPNVQLKHLHFPKLGVVVIRTLPLRE